MQKSIDNTMLLLQHAQLVARLPTGLVRVDAELVSLIEEINAGIHPFAKTDFSCQGDPGKPTVSAYLLISSRDDGWLLEFADALSFELKHSALGYRPRRIDEGYFPGDQKKVRRGSRVMLTHDLANFSLLPEGPMRDQFTRVWPGGTYMRLVIRWRPEDYEPVAASLLGLCRRYAQGKNFQDELLGKHPAAAQ